MAEVSTKIATAGDESLSKQQKAHFLLQQLAAINAELQRLEPADTDLHGSRNIAEDEGDLDVLVRRVDALPALVESCGSWLLSWVAHVDVRGLSPPSAPSPVFSLPSSPTVADTDAAGGSDESARLGGAGNTH
jgi:hypothetical protein